MVPAQIIVEDYWWDDDTFCIKEKGTGHVYRCEHAWPSAISFGGLDYSSKEEATIELTARYEPATG